MSNSIEKQKPGPVAPVRITRAAGAIGAATLITRMFGYVRDMIIAGLFGTGMPADAFLIAFTIPNFFRRLFSEGSLTMSFVPVFSDLLQSRGQSEGARMASAAFRALFGAAALLSLVGIVLAPLIVHLIAGGFSDIPEKFTLCVRLTRIMSPYLLFICLSALCMGILNVYGCFAAPALSPVCLNGAMIGAALAGYQYATTPSGQITWVAVGVLAGGACQLALQWPFLWQNQISVGLRGSLWHPSLGRVLILMGPALFSAAAYQVNSLVVRLMASSLEQGSVSCLYYADRLIQFPLGIFALSAATAVLPSLSAQASQKDWEAMGRTCSHALRFILFVMMPATAGLIVLRQPIVKLLFQHGAFDALSTRLTADALLYYTFGLWAVAAGRIILNTFYAIQDTGTPLRAAAAAMLSNVIAGALLLKTMQHSGLALAVSLSAVINLGMLIPPLHRRLKRGLQWRRIGVSVSKSTLSAVLMGSIVHALANRLLPEARDFGHVDAAVRLAVCIGAGSGAYALLAYACKAPELQAFTHYMAKRKSHFEREA